MRTYRIEKVFVVETDHQFVDQRISEARDLLAGNVLSLGAMHELSDDGPSADDAVGLTISCEAWARYFENEGIDVLLGQIVVVVVLGNGIREPRDGYKVDQVEDGTQIDEEGLCALTNEDLAKLGVVTTEWYVHLVDVLIRVGFILREGLLSCVIERLGEDLATRTRARSDGEVSLHVAVLVSL